MYYIWRHDITNKTKRVVEAGLSPSNPWFKYISMNFFYKEILSPDMPPLPIEYGTSSGPKLPVFDYIMPLNLNYQIISEKLYALLNSYSIPYMDFYPATLLIDKTGEVRKNLYSFNIRKEFDFTNITESEYRADEDDIIRKYTKLVLNEKDIPPELKFFRLKHSSFSYFIVHEDIRNECIDKGITGVRFIPVEKWNDDKRYML